MIDGIPCQNPRNICFDRIIANAILKINSFLHNFCANDNKKLRPYCSDKVFSDKLCLRVVDLTHIDLATEEDKLFEIDRWARLFKATTWEEIKMIAEGNETLMQATQALFECNTDELIRQQCYAREEYYKYQRTIDKALKDATAERDQLAEAKAQLTEEKAKAIETIQKQEEEILRLKALLASK